MLIQAVVRPHNFQPAASSVIFGASHRPTPRYTPFKRLDQAASSARLTVVRARCPDKSIEVAAQLVQAGPQWLKDSVTQGIECLHFEDKQAFVRSSPKTGQVSCFRTENELFVKQKDGALLQGSVATLGERTLHEALALADQPTQKQFLESGVEVQFKEKETQTGLSWSNTPVTYDWIDHKTLRVQLPTVSIPAWMKLGGARKNARLPSLTAAASVINTVLLHTQCAAPTSVKCTTQQLGGLETDLYLRQDAKAAPVVILLQGAGVAKDQYSDFSSRMAQRGYGVFVPEHGPSVGGRTWTCVSLVQPSTVAGIWSDVQKKAMGSQLLQRLDLSRLCVIGHSYGGAQIMSMLSSKNPKPLMSKLGALPSQTRAVVLLNVNNKIGFIPQARLRAEQVPVFVIQGDEDRISKREHTVSMVANANTKAMKAVFLKGVNHYGSTNSDGAGALRVDAFSTKPMAKAAVLEKMVDEIEGFITEMPEIPQASQLSYKTDAIDVSLRMDRTGDQL